MRLSHSIKSLLHLLLCTLPLFLLTACGSEAAQNNSSTVTLPSGTAAPTVTAPLVSVVPSEPASVAAEPVLLTYTDEGSYAISELLYGLFLEDINFAVDGGLYAELIKNRSFEYGSMARNGALHGWQEQDTNDCLSVTVVNGAADGSCLNENNPQYAVLEHTGGLSEAGIYNTGFLDGMAVQAGADYRLSLFLRAPEGYDGTVTVRLADQNGTVYAETSFSALTSDWRKYEATLTSSATVQTGLRLSVTMTAGLLHTDMISLFPADTYNGRENGLRKDLVEMLAALSPAFLRFPGGCVVEGESLDNAYSWKDSIGNGLPFEINGIVTYGDVAARPLGENLWGNENSASAHPYYMSYGMGFYEYFLLCEDLGCAPVPIVNAGLSCLIQGTRTVGTATDTLPLDSAEFLSYIQDALDLVEFCRGDETTTWGALRAAMGHPAPFPLHYLGIGNEQWNSAYYRHYEAFLDAFAEKAAENPAVYGDLTLIVANGPNSGDTYAWRKIEENGTDYAGLVDEHYYQTPSWFLANTSRYDTYDRASVPVFLGEYAAKSNNLEAALAEAAFMTGLERNGDIVALASYAPLFGNDTSTQWTPDLIWFSKAGVRGSVNYYVQQLFAVNKSTRILPSVLSETDVGTTALSGRIGVGTWQTAAQFSDILVVSNETGAVLFDGNAEDAAFEPWEGDWSFTDGSPTQTYRDAPFDTVTGDTAYAGETDWQNYTLTLNAVKEAGAEGFLIPFAVQNTQNFFHWNLGGWGNTVSCLEQTTNGSKSGQIAETVRSCAIQTGQTYQIKITVSGSRITCYLDGRQMIDYTVPSADALYQVCGTDENGDILIKLVNVTKQDIAVRLRTELPMSEGIGTVLLLSGSSPLDSNSAANPRAVVPETIDLNISGNFVYTAPRYSVSVLRIPAALLTD